MPKPLSSSEMYQRRFGARWGRLLAGIIAARHAIAIATNERSLLDDWPSLRDELQDVHHRLAGIEQSAWVAEGRQADGKRMAPTSSGRGKKR